MAEMYDRFTRTPNAALAALAQAHITLVGGGGQGGEVAVGLARKGVGQLTLFDYDIVELSNLPRQQFRPRDVGRNKALALASNLRTQATGGTLIEGHALSFQDAVEAGMEIDGILVVAVDNNPTRLAAARYCLSKGLPALLLGVDAEAAKGYVFVQTSQAGQACFSCAFPDAQEDRGVHGCVGASLEILKVVAGIALYAIDSLLMPRPRPWNYKEVFLARGGDGHRTLAVRPGCALCDGGASPA